MEFLRIERRQDHVGDIHLDDVAPLLEVEIAVAVFEQVFQQFLLQLLRGAAGRDALREIDLRLRHGGLLLAPLPHLLTADEIRSLAAATRLDDALGAPPPQDEHPLVDVHQPARTP